MAQEKGNGDESDSSSSGSGTSQSGESAGSLGTGTTASSAVVSPQLATIGTVSVGALGALTKQPGSATGRGIASMDKEVGNLLDVIAEFEAATPSEARERLLEAKRVLRQAKQTVLRLNLAKNLARTELYNSKEEARVERQLLVKSLEGKERTLELLRNENEMITARNLKLIRHCRQLKEKKVRKLREENKELRRLLEDGEAGTSTATSTASNSAGAAGAAVVPLLAAPASAQPSLALREASTDTVGDAPISATRQSSALDTLGRLASHVLRDGRYN